MTVTVTAIVTGTMTVIVIVTMIVITIVAVVETRAVLQPKLRKKQGRKKSSGLLLSRASQEHYCLLQMPIV